jgi:hypothetical protein
LEGYQARSGAPRELLLKHQHFFCINGVLKLHKLAQQTQEQILHGLAVFVHCPELPTLKVLTGICIRMKGQGETQHLLPRMALASDTAIVNAGSFHSADILVSSL